MLSLIDSALEPEAVEETLSEDLTIFEDVAVSAFELASDSAFAFALFEQPVRIIQKIKSKIRIRFSLIRQ